MSAGVKPDSRTPVVYNDRNTPPLREQLVPMRKGVGLKPSIVHPTNLLVVILLVAVDALQAQPSRGSGTVLGADLERSLRDAGGERIKVWVYFADHSEENADELRDMLAEVTLTTRSLERRMRRSTLGPVDLHDLPVCEEYIDAVRSEGCRIRHASKYMNAVSVLATPDEIRRIARLPFVDKIERVRTGYRKLPVRIELPTMPGSQVEREGNRRDGGLSGTAMVDSTFYGLSELQNRQINVPPLHDLGFHGEGVLVAMLDTGYERINHALSHLRVVAEWDFIDDDPVTSPEPGDPEWQEMHGSLSLGTIAAFWPGAVIGPAWGADYALAKTERFWDEIQTEEDDFVRALEWADSLGADIVSSSLGYFYWYTYPDVDGDTAVITRAADIAASRGILVVTAAGNEGPLPWPGIIVPADGDSVVAVGAADSLGLVTSFSSRGPTYDGRIKPDVLAMGEIVASINWSDTTGLWAFNGTSAATPLVAGACALILQRHPDWAPMEVLEALRATASHADSPDNDFGWGVVDAYAASERSATRVVTFEMIPGSCAHPFNPKSRGRVPAILFGTEDLDVDDIDPTSLLVLDRAAPLKIDVNDHGSANREVARGCSDTSPDGIEDLMLHFAAADIAGALPEARKGDVVALGLTARLRDGTWIEGTAEVTIVGGDAASAAGSDSLTTGRGAPLAAEEPLNTGSGARLAAGVTLRTELGTVVPNPFNPITRIPYSLASDGRVRLSVYDSAGRLVERLIEGERPAGHHSARWDARGRPSGVYFCRLEVGDFVATRKLVVVK